jgi:hypothetical protein
MSEHCQNNVRTLSEHCQNNVRTLSEHCQNNVRTISEHCQNNVRTISEHCQNNVRTMSESNIKILKRGKIDTPKKNTLPLTFLAWYRHFNKNNVAVFN